MKLIIKPEEVIVKPAEYKVVFHEGRDYPKYVGGDTWETMNDFRSDITEWLNTHAEGWKAVFDRGDWGEGVAFVTISFVTEEQAKAFVEKFETIPCPNSEERGRCPNMHKAIKIAKERTDGRAACPECGHPIWILNDHNREEFYEHWAKKSALDE